MWKHINSFFGFNKRERHGVITLLLILFTIIIVDITIPYFNKNTNKYPEKEFLTLVKELKNAKKEAKPKPKYSNDTISYKTQQKIDYFSFDPNNLSQEKWRKLGLSKAQIKVIKNYETKGGRFYKKTDLQKIYSISKKQYDLLAPYIIIETTGTKGQKKSYKTKIKAPITIIDINSADSSELKKLSGIGSILSKRIIKFRDYLGGFYTKKQLQEVYGLDSATYSKISPYIKINTSGIRKININTATFKQLLKHPYLDYTTVKSIIIYREKHGRFQCLETLHNSNLIDADLYNKITPYLSL